MNVNGVHYHLETSGAGEPLLLLHGFSGSAAHWQPLGFAESFRVIAPDLLGHGQTDSPPDPARYRMEQAVLDLIVLLDALDLSTVNLLGYSMGGRLALDLALSYPQRIRSLILESASPGLKTEAERQARITSDQALADRIERDGVPAFADYWSTLPLFASQPPEIRAQLHAQRLRNHPTGLANSLRGMGTGAQPSLWDRLSGLDRRVLLICGALDAKFCAINRDMRDHLPQASLVIIPDAGHTTHAEQPERFRAEVLRFLLS